jgi:hypothetical protein
MLRCSCRRSSARHLREYLDNFLDSHHRYTMTRLCSWHTCLQVLRELARLRKVLRRQSLKAAQKSFLGHRIHDRVGCRVVTTKGGA